LRIQQDGSIVKFVESVFKVVFSGSQAIKYGKETVYITERATFRLTHRGLVLEEVAPGIDIDKDIISKMGFQPIVSSAVREMDKKLFQKGKVGMRNEIIQIMKR
jgi:acyl CoA:acetate/3-ketoacid CoA transferase